jgi:hypothetical protein
MAPRLGMIPPKSDPQHSRAVLYIGRVSQRLAERRTIDLSGDQPLDLGCITRQSQRIDRTSYHVA